MKMKICGIYKIENRVNGKAYVGSSINVNRRLQCHRNALRANRHHAVLEEKNSGHVIEAFQQSGDTLIDHRLRGGTVNEPMKLLRRTSPNNVSPRGSGLPLPLTRSIAALRDVNSLADFIALK